VFITTVKKNQQQQQNDKGKIDKGNCLGLPVAG